MIKLTVLLLGLLLLGTRIESAEAAATLTVCPNGCDHTTIQAAINAATDGDLIQLLMTAAHTEPDIVVNKSVTIEGLGETLTIVQAADSLANSTARVFTVLGDYNVTLREMTIRYGDPASGGGGGILVVGDFGNSTGLLLVESVTITNNEGLLGGGIRNDGGNVTLDSSSVRYNDGAVGGGIYNGDLGTLIVRNSSFFFGNEAYSGAGIYSSFSTLTVYGGLIWQNKLTDEHGTSTALRCGGGIAVRGGTATLAGVTFDQNEDLIDSPAGHGGGLCISSAGVSAEHLSFEENATDLGGGLYVESSTLTLSNLTFDNNSATEGGGYYQTGGNMLLSRTAFASNNAAAGGAIYVESGLFNLRQSSLDSNSAGSGGGLFHNDGTSGLTNVTISRNNALLLGGGAVILDGVVTFANTTIAENVVTGTGEFPGIGGGVHVCDCPNDVHLKSTIIDDNLNHSGDTPDCNGEFATAYDSLVGDRGTNNQCSWTRTSDGMISNQSAVLAPLDGSGYIMHFPLTQFSPPIDMGNCDDAQGGTISTDQRGYAAPVSGGNEPARVCDMGSYEYNSTLVPTAVGISGQAADAVAVNSEQWTVALFLILLVTTVGARAACPPLRPRWSRSQ